MTTPDRGELIVYRTEDGQLPKASAVKECLTTAEGGQLPEAETVKDSLTVQNDGGHKTDAEEIAELERIERQLEQKKDKR